MRAAMRCQMKTMKAIKLPHLLIGLAMLAAAGLALALTPRLKLADQGPKISLEAMIPKQFGEWKLEETITSLIVSPDVQGPARQYLQPDADA